MVKNKKMEILEKHMLYLYTFLNIYILYIVNIYFK